MFKRTAKFALPIIISLVFLITLVPGCGGTTTTPTTSPTPTQSGTPTPTPPAQNSIVLGASRDITGPQAGFQAFGFAAVYKMWLGEGHLPRGHQLTGKT